MHAVYKDAKQCSRFIDSIQKFVINIISLVELSSMEKLHIVINISVSFQTLRDAEAFFPFRNAFRRINIIFRCLHM